MILQKIGYFDDFNRALIAPLLKLTEPDYSREKILSYMSSGIPLFSWLEHVPCMYGCSKENIGSTEHTDGTWIWTKEFAHYIELHNIAIPESFITHMENASYIFIETSATEKIKKLAQDISNLEAEIRYSSDLWMCWITARCPGAKLSRVEPECATPPSTVKKNSSDLPDDW